MPATLRRHAEPEPFVLGALAVDYAQRRVTVDGEAVDLTATEYELGGGSPDGDGFAHPRPWGPGAGMPVMTGMPGVSGMDMGSMTGAMSMAGQQPPMGHGSGEYPRDRASRCCAPTRTACSPTTAADRMASR